MPSESLNTRREFLKTLALFCGLGLANVREFSGTQAEAAAAKYKIAPWTGDDFTLGHRMRIGDIPSGTPADTREVDFVIAGGGMSGLATAYYLRNENFLLLEQYSELGGQSRGRSYRGLQYSFGPAYLGSREGLVGQALSDLSLAPAEIPHTAKNAWYRHKEWIPGINSSKQPDLHKDFDKLLEQCRPIWKLMPAWGHGSPVTVPELEKLDSIPFSSLLKSYTPDFQDLINRYCLSSLCGSSEVVSALAGTYMMQDLIASAYVLKGGNPALSRALTAAIDKTGRGRTQANSFVWSIRQSGGKLEVLYSTGDSTMHKVVCRKAIVTAPPMVAGRICQDLSDIAKAFLLWQKYGSYLVANFCLRKREFTGAYDNWAGIPFSFTDIILAETPYLQTHSYKPDMGSVMTVYQPYPPSSPGRALLLAGNRQEFADTLTSQLGKLVEHFNNNFEEVVLTRWGHAMVVPVPSFFTKLAKLQALDTEPILLAHNSTAGLPAAESAFAAARRAADRALGVAKEKNI